MRLLLAALLIALLASPVWAAPPPSDTDRAAAQTVIRSQLDAFRRDDAAAAFSFASPTIQGAFGDPATFLAMVRTSYQAVYRPRAVDFTTLSAEAAGLTQRVELIGPDGLGYTATYTLEKESSGEWRISGCTLAQSARVET